MEKDIIIGQLAFVAVWVSAIIAIIIYLIINSIRPKNTMFNNGLAKRPPSKIQKNVTIDIKDKNSLKIKYADDMYNVLVNIYENEEVWEQLWESQKRYIIHILERVGYKFK